MLISGRIIGKSEFKMNFSVKTSIAIFIWVLPATDLKIAAERIVRNVIWANMLIKYFKKNVFEYMNFIVHKNCLF